MKKVILKYIVMIAVFFMTMVILGVGIGVAIKVAETIARFSA